MLTADLTARWRARLWVVASHIPWPLWWPLVGLGVVVMAVFPAPPVKRWAHNFATMTGSSPTRRDVVRGLWSWARSSVTSLQLTGWDSDKVARCAYMGADDYRRLTSAMHTSGAVLAVSHSASWDLGGIWACHNGMPLSTVAEELATQEFQVFIQLRQALGFTVYGHRDPMALRNLVTDAKTGHLVCLLADRDFSVRGLPVVWHTGSGDHPATMPVGPAQVAQRSGAQLMGAVCHYEAGRMRLVLSEPLEPAPECTTHLEKLSSLTQQLCDFFAIEIRRHPHDWHMMAPFFDRDAT